MAERVKYITKKASGDFKILQMERTSIIKHKDIERKTRKNEKKSVDEEHLLPKGWRLPMGWMLPKGGMAQKG